MPLKYNKKNQRIIVMANRPIKAVSKIL